MSRKQDTATALAGILSAKRGGDSVSAPALSIATQEEPEAAPPPSPALPPSPPVMAAKKVEPAVAEGRGGKSSDPNYRQYSVYLRKTTRKKVGRVLDDADTGQDFSELMEELLQQWLASRT
jgi:hypothetical protein